MNKKNSCRGLKSDISQAVNITVVLLQKREESSNAAANYCNLKNWKDQKKLALLKRKTQEGRKAAHR